MKIIEQCKKLRNYYLRECTDYEFKIELLDKLIKHSIQYGVTIPLSFKNSAHTKEQIISTLVKILDDLGIYNYSIISNKDIIWDYKISVTILR